MAFCKTPETDLLVERDNTRGAGPMSIYAAPQNVPCSNNHGLNSIFWFWYANSNGSRGFYCWECAKREMISMGFIKKETFELFNMGDQCKK